MIDAKGPDHIGEKITNFKLKTLQGEKVKIHDVIKDKVAVISFTTTWCSDCKKLAGILYRMIPGYRDKGVEFCFIYVGQDQTIVSKENKRTSENSNPIRLLDEKRKAFLQWQLSSIPHLIIIDKKGIVKYEGICLEEKQIISEIEKVIGKTSAL
jgi:peroxiredoxin